MLGSGVDLATETTGTIASADSVEAIFKSFDDSADKIGLTGKLAETFLQTALRRTMMVLTTLLLVQHSRAAQSLEAR